MTLDMRYFGDPVLREKAAPIEVFDEDLQALSRNMLETMRAEKGVGLAAQQVGLTDAICVVEVPEECDQDDQGERLHPDLAMPLVLINPTVTDASQETWVSEEGCLSFPDIGAPIKRPCNISLRYQALDGTWQERQLQGFLARVVQHEIDHLNGVLFIDRMTPVKRAALSGRLKRMRRETQAQLA